jgi:serine/threonine-protein kinase
VTPRAPGRRLPPVRTTARVGPRELKRLRAGRSSRYVRRGVVAQGGMGVVLRVWDRLLRRAVAMKVQPTRGPGATPEAIARFLREGQVAAQLQHPGVIAVHDLGIDERGRLYFTMPLVEGRDLRALFDRARGEHADDSLDAALRALVQVCEVVAFAHSRGVIHGDLKPTNVLVGRHGDVHVVDWGLATLAPGGATDGVVAGTPTYMAPEVVEGRASVRSDVYALGAMLYRLLAGRGPYAPRRGREDARKTLELLKRGPATPVSRLAPDAPPELVAICERAMSRDPADRHASADALAAELRAWLGSRVADGRHGGRRR